MKNKIFIIMLMFFSITLFSCSGNKEKNALDTIKEKGKIILAVSPDYPPYEFYSSNDGKKEIIGADLFLAQKIADGLGVELEIQEMAFDSLLAAVSSGRCDMAISGINPNEQRRKAVDFSDVYFTGKSIFLIKKDADDITSEDYFKSDKVKVGVQKGSIQEKLAKEALNMKDSNIQALSDVPNLLQELKNKRIDVVILGEDVAKIAAAKDSSIKISSFAASQDDEQLGMAIAFKKGNDNESLLVEVNKVISEIKEKDEFSKELDKFAKIAAKN